MRPHRCERKYFQGISFHGSTGIGIESFADITVGVDPSYVEEGCDTYDTIECEDVRKIVNSETDINAKENVELKMDNGDTIEGFFKDGLRNGLCVVNPIGGKCMRNKGKLQRRKTQWKGKNEVRI